MARAAEKQSSRLCSGRRSRVIWVRTVSSLQGTSKMTSGGNEGANQAAFKAKVDSRNSDVDGQQSERERVVEDEGGEGFIEVASKST